MELGGISSAYADYMQSQNTAATKLKVCKQFEAYFLEQVFKEMQKTVDCMKEDNTSKPTGNLVNYFKDTAIQDLAATSTEVQGLGLAQIMYEQMKRNYNLT